MSGVVPAGAIVRGACQRHINDLEKSKTLPGYPFYYDKHKASEAIRFFEEYLFLNGGQFEGLPFLLLPWQAFIIGSIYGWVRKSDDYRRFRVVYIETPKGPLALDTPIATLDGWTTMGEIKIGDHVFDEKGLPTKVIGVSSVFYNRKCFRVTFSDGSQIIADSEHRWPTRSYREDGRVRLKTTDEISKSMEAWKTGCSLLKNHHIQVAPALELPASELIIPPYVLGVFLGDGDTDSSRITVHRDDWEIVQYIQDDGVAIKEQQEYSEKVARVSMIDGNGRKTLGRKVVSAALNIKHFTLSEMARITGCDSDRISKFIKKNELFEMISPRINPGFGNGTIASTWRLSLEKRQKAQDFVDTSPSMLSRLRSLGLIGSKFIPNQYLRASHGQRLLLLQGIMDTDGSVAKGGRCEITLCNKRLIYDVQELLISLGYKCSIYESAAKIKGREVGRRWRLCFQAYDTFPVFRLSRKKKKLVPAPAKGIRSLSRAVVSCDEIKSVPVRCITVESESHLFLAGKSLIILANSGKSPLAAGVGLKGLVADQEPRAEIYAAATYRDQAMVLFRDAVAFYDQSPQLREMLVPSGTGSTRWNLAYLEKGSFFRVISSEKKGQSGPRPHVVLLDEIHEHKDGTVIEMLRAGFKFRRQPLSFMISNSGHDKTSVCWEYHELGEKVACEQLQNDEVFAYICSLDDEDLKDDKYLTDESLWTKVNPSLEYGLPGYDYIRAQVAEAKGMPSKMSTVKRLCFCQWTESENPAISKDVWMACQDKDYSDDILLGRRCWGGLDLSAVNDLTAFSLIFEPSQEDSFWRLKAWFWVPGIGLINKSDKDHVPYIAWRDAGYITAIDRNSIEYDFVIVDLKKLSVEFDIQKIAFDRWNMKVFQKDLARLGIELPELVEFGQGYKSMSPAIKVFEKKLLDTAIKHDGNPCLTWNASNVVAIEDPADNKKYIKPNSGARIDGIISSVMACGIIEETGIKSAYDGLTSEEISSRMAL